MDKNDTIFDFNFTAVPNIILDNMDVIAKTYGDSSLKALLFIARKTFGWSKLKDRISYSQIQKGIGCTKANAIIAVKKLVDAKLVKQTSSGQNRPNCFEIDVTSIAGNTSFHKTSIAGNTDNIKERLNKVSKDTRVSKLTLSPETIELIGYWNKNGSVVTSHSIEKKTKTVLSIDRIIRMLIKGTFVQKHPIITKNVMTSNSIDPMCQQRKFTVDDIKTGIDSFMLQFKNGYWPFTTEGKRKLPRSFLAFLFNPYNHQCPSAFLKLFYNKPKKIDIINLNADERKASKIVQNMFELAIYKRALKDEELMQIDKVVKAISERRKEAINGIGKQYKRFIKDNYFDAVVGFDDDCCKFVKEYSVWLRKDSKELAAFFAKSGITNNPISISSIAPDKKKWSSFIKYLKNEYKICLEPDDDERFAVELRAKEVERAVV